MRLSTLLVFFFLEDLLALTNTFFSFVLIRTFELFRGINYNAGGGERRLRRDVWSFIT